MTTDELRRLADYVMRFRRPHYDRRATTIARAALLMADVVDAARYMSCQDHLTKPREDCCYCAIDRTLAAFDAAELEE